MGNYSGEIKMLDIPARTLDKGTHTFLIEGGNSSPTDNKIVATSAITAYRTDNPDHKYYGASVVTNYDNFIHPGTHLLSKFMSGSNVFTALNIQASSANVIYVNNLPAGTLIEFEAFKVLVRA